MKHYTIIPILISIFCLGFHTLQAQGLEATLTVYSEGEAFWLFLDDVQVNEQPVKSIKVNMIPEGKYYMRVEMDNREHISIGQYVILNPVNHQYTIKKRQSMYGIFSTRDFLWSETVVNYPRMMPQPQFQPRPQGPHHLGESHFSNVPMPMNNADFQEALTYIQSKNFDKDKMSAAKQLLVNNFMTVNQIEQVCRLFSFDKDKLEFAKYAYSRCVDQNRYFMLNSVFSFESSKTEMDEFVQQQH